ncbi:uncharacterized protein UMAG_03471 [Mycosarcoma maydis]|uniref:Uncharacterized protein n=1 Tax=Mycosarcoma maydis TaxID=5270 RepID=A0A0D1C3T7_MYCMD|nr:uncharacterized protein UMAG_03471 [Ustilago maydis 521]KIS68377.1 hypothetical protein UMAG_03471 [Ustilago maydis 521]|eukprot:XP_011389927.1 hypothetical protein UMAG_03471 [Ustilago maydis 521]
MASASAPPELSQPSTLLTHPTPAAADLARYVTLPATPFATAKTSTISVGSAYKLSSDARSLRRLKATLPILIAGHALNLVNPQTQTPIQSFTLSSAEIASSPPLTLLRALSARRSLRTTYIGIQSYSRAKSGDAALTATHHLCAYIEQLSAKGKESAKVDVNKVLLSVNKPIRLIHALGDGRLVLTHSDDSLTIVSALSFTYDNHNDSNNVDDDDQVVSNQALASSFQVIDTIHASQHRSADRCHFYVNLLDAASAKGLIAASSKIEDAAVVGLRVAITSDVKSSSSSSSSSTSTTTSNIQDDAAKKKKRSKRSKHGLSQADDDQLQDTDNLLPLAHAPTGPLILELTAFVKSFDGAESSIATIKLGQVQVPSISNARHVVDVQMHPHGRLAVLGFDGQLTSMSLATSASSEPLLSNLNINRLDALAHASSSRASSSSTASPSCCLLLSRDHALIVGVTRPTPATADKERVVALIVDLELNAVLKQIDWALPMVPVSSTAASSSGLLQRMSSISASRIAGSTSIITIGPPTLSSRTSSSSDKAEALAQLHQRRVCLLSLPFVVPEMSVLRDALGKGQLTARWMQTSDQAILTRSGVQLDASRTALLEQIQTISQGSNKPASKGAELHSAVSSWLDVATQDGRMLETLSAHEADSVFFGELLQLLLPAPPQRSSKGNGVGSAPLLARAALLALLKHPRAHPSIFATLRPCRATEAPTANVSVQANGAGLAEFWSRLAAWNDAQLTRAALKRMPDIGEDTFVSVLLSALRGLLQIKRRGDAVSAKTTRPYMALLAHVVQLRVSRPTLRSALKAQLRDDVNPVMALLQLCNAWLSQIIQLPLSEVEAKSHATVAGQARVPDADAVMALANDVLDTFFPLLLVTPRSHATVQSLSRTISRYLQLMSTLRLLNAPLSAFAKLQQECELVARTEAADKSHKAGGTTLSASGAVASAGNAKVQPSSKADAAARAEMGGGLGIKLGTQGEAKTRRVHLLEQSMLVGAYSFERLEI